MNKFIPSIVAMTAIVLTPACAQQSVDKADKKAVEQIVRSYILENPEIIEEALIALQEKRTAEEAEMASQAFAANADALFNSVSDYSVGPDDAPVTVVEFFDYRCGFCKRSADWAMALPEVYDGQVRVVFKELPILSAETGFDTAAIDGAARAAGVDVSKMRADMDSVDIQRQLADMTSLARTLGITGTPNFVVGTSQVPGADESMVRALIDAELAALD